MLDTLFAQYDSILVLDTETTGIDCKKEEIIELAALQVSMGGALQREMDVFVRLPQDKKLPQEITRLTGITPAMLENEGVEQEQAASRFAVFLQPKTLVVAYNAQFDLCFLYYFLNRFGKAALLKNARFLDAMTVYKDRRDYPHKLANAVDAYQLTTQNTHRAIDDATATLELLIAMEQEKPDLERYVNLFGYNAKYGVSGPRIGSITYRTQGYDRSAPLYEKE